MSPSTLEKRSRPVRRGSIQPSPVVLALSFAVLIGLGVLLGVIAYLLSSLHHQSASQSSAPSTNTPPSSVLDSPAALQPSSLAPAPQVGSPAPEIGLPDLAGRQVTLESLRGRVVLINFWASWCPPCEKEMSDLQALYQEESGRGLVVLGINEGEEPGRAAEFLSRNGITFPTVPDQGMQITTRYEVFGLPNSFFIDANGIVRARVVGPFSLDDMRGHLARVRQGQDVEAVRVQSVAAASVVDGQRPAAEVNGITITLHEVNRRVDLESALIALKGGLAPDLTQAAHAGDLRRLQRSLAERMVDERLVAARSAAVGLVIPEADVDADVRQTAEELRIESDALASALAANGSDIAVLREAHRTAQLMGRYVAEYVLTGNNDERLDDFEQWMGAARRRAGARVLLPET
jgi:peroxiredoxin